MITLMQGDCLEKMKDIPDGSVDLVLTDPPYGIDFQSMWKKDKQKRMGKILNDKKPFVEFLDNLKRIISPGGAVLIFTRWDVQQAFVDAMTQNKMKPKNVLIWGKKIHGMGDLKRAYGSRYESILFWSNDQFRFNGKRPTDIIQCQRVSPASLLHPNKKPVHLLETPVHLLETLISQTTTEGCTVSDLFMGSGSTGVACVNTSRNFIGIELDENYFNIAKNRIEQTVEQKSKE